MTSADLPAPEQPLWLRLPYDRIGLFLGPTLLLVWLAVVPRGALSVEAHRLAGVLLLTLLWWITEPIPIPVTALLSVFLCVTLGAVPTTPSSTGEKVNVAKLVLAPFADPSVYFLFGGLFIGRAMSRHGLDRRLALGILCQPWAGRSPSTLLAGVGLSVMLVSMWISNTAATAMMYPVTLGIISVLAASNPLGDRSFRASPFASALLLTTAYASSVGGISTPIGTATNVVSMSFLRKDEYLGQSISFLPWCLLGLPMSLLIFVGMFSWLKFLAPIRSLDMTQLRSYLLQEQAKLGAWRRGEWNTLLVFVTIVTLWITPSVLKLSSQAAEERFLRRFPEEITALLAPIALFLLPIDWRQRRMTLEPEDLLQIDWSTMLLFGAGVSLGNLIKLTGLSDVLGRQFFVWLGTNDVWVLTAVAIAAGIFLSELTSNVATVIALLPVINQLCADDASPLAKLPPLLGLTFGASFGSALPVSTPPNAIVYSSGLVPLPRMVLAGLGVDLVCGVVIWLVLRLAFGLGWQPFG